MESSIYPKHEKRLEKGGFTNEMIRTKLYEIPRYHWRLLYWLMALLPNPDVILMNDLTAGLSLPVKWDFWRLIQMEQSMRPRKIFFAQKMSKLLNHSAEMFGR